MKKIISKIIIIVTLITLINLTSCKNEVMNMPTDQNINFPAAYVVNGENGSISVIRLSDNTVNTEIMLMDRNNMIMWPHHIYLNPTKNQLAIGVPGMDLSAGHSGGMEGMNGRVLIIDPTTLTIIKNLSVPIMNHNAVFVNNGSEIWTSQMDSLGKVLVYDATSYTLKNTISVGEEPAEVTLSADGTKAYVCNGKSNSVTIINPTTKAVITTVSVPANPVGAWTASNGKMFVDCEDGQKVVVLDVATNAIDQTIDLGFMPGFAAYSASNNELWVTDPMAGKVHYWTWDAGMNMWVQGGSIATGAGAHAIAFTGSTAYVTNQTANTVSAVNVTNRTVTKTINVGKKPNGIVIRY